MIRVGIVGGTGYTGVELLRLLAAHPEVEVAVITSRAEKGVRVDELYPSLRGHYGIEFTTPDAQQLAECDVVFFATPHGVAQAMMAELLAFDTRVIDLSADFRIKDIELWEQWYNQPHGCPELVAEAVYGLPEVNREAIKSARLVACAGCYPTSVQLGLIPLLEQGLVDPSRLIANAASGVSGAGRGASVANLFAETSDSFKAYAAPGHRHLPEIKQGLTEAAGEPVGLTFVPHLLPMTRGIHATLYSELTVENVDLQGLFEERYRDEPFVDVLPAGSHPQTRSVKGTNTCSIAVHQPQGGNTAVVLSAIDNLCKGASGQAVQCLNIMFGFDEKTGLNNIAVAP
ncbi:N-acetyl-gamma-glutamyl-phosphate reductase [Sinobacterium norvegicum]|uniref:N-acetyl-gamma-glutamyl-phosphate reductase n=1 Tax=Sinobacterium norvegicum TaxID=1641715 RepID=A0ABN8EK44_9GAMM|nr:N-acetyl-gamma-glutamyl-phosphate reductase [Sinobacterium norvegicum]CAH0992803.1 N-acetyl-gamma-glutamyl-phosphate reductase [Sinobacterium norvegicum]